MISPEIVSGRTIRAERRIQIGALLVAIAILAIGLTTVRLIVQMVNDSRWVEHTQQVMDGIDKLDDEVTRMEAAREIYQLTGDEAFLSRYRERQRDVLELLKDLETLTQDNQGQQNHLRAFERVLHEYDTLSTSDAHLSRPVLKLPNVPDAKNGTLTAPFDYLIAQLRQTEQTLFKQRRADEESSVRWAYGILAVLGIVLAGVLGGTYFVAVNALDSRRVALQKRDSLNRELEDANRALEIKRAEADQANRLKSQFLASMSHELRTPLNAISGFSELLDEQLAGPLTEKQKRFVGHIRQASKHLLQLINDVLDLSKIEAGELRFDVASLNPAAIVEEVVAGVTALSQEKRISVRVEVEGQLGLKADTRRLKQILYNLLSNALKFTPEDGRVDVSAWRQGDRVWFEVADNGPGISPEDQGVIFEEFRQAAVPSSGVKEGTGLGLAITKQLVERQGGRIEVDSKIGEGSRFRFWLPAAVRESNSRQCIEDARAGTAVSIDGASKRPLVLVVDNDPQACELIVDVLENAGYDVITADSGREALVAVRERQPDLITLDLLMPAGHGFGTLYELRSAFGEKAPPVIIVSVLDDRATGFALGATDYLLKPVSREDLLKCVIRHLPPANANVLVIDDDPAVLDLAKEVFSESWMTVHLAANGKEGLKVVSSTHVDAIVLDLMMPEMDGFEFLTELRKDETLSHIPVAVLTGKELSEYELQMLKDNTAKLFYKQDQWRPQLIRELTRSMSRVKGRISIS